MKKPKHLKFYAEELLEQEVEIVKGLAKKGFITVYSKVVPDRGTLMIVARYGITKTMLKPIVKQEMKRNEKN